MVSWWSVTVPTIAHSLLQVLLAVYLDAIPQAVPICGAFGGPHADHRAGAISHSGRDAMSSASATRQGGDLDPLGRHRDPVARRQIVRTIRAISRLQTDRRPPYGAAGSGGTHRLSFREPALIEAPVHLARPAVRLSSVRHRGPLSGSLWNDATKAPRYHKVGAGRLRFISVLRAEVYLLQFRLGRVSRAGWKRATWTRCAPKSRGTLGHGGRKRSIWAAALPAPWTREALDVAAGADSRTSLAGGHARNRSRHGHAGTCARLGGCRHRPREPGRAVVRADRNRAHGTQTHRPDRCGGNRAAARGGHRQNQHRSDRRSFRADRSKLARIPRLDRAPGSPITSPSTCWKWMRTAAWDARSSPVARVTARPTGPPSDLTADLYEMAVERLAALGLRALRDLQFRRCRATNRGTI